MPDKDLARKAIEDNHALLHYGTRAAVYLVAACIAGAFALCIKLIWGSLAASHDELMLRLLLSCIACFVGMAFAGLGFGLFLMQAQGLFSAEVVDTTTDVPPRRLGSIVTNAPGLVVVVCATIVIGLALDLRWTRTTTGADVHHARTQLDPSDDGVMLPVFAAPEQARPPQNTPVDDDVQLLPLDGGP